ncbi:MAG: hypothetical protein ACI9ON_001895 [Limisphaerales bacterium]|jgi:hypothetical protein
MWPRHKLPHRQKQPPLNRLADRPAVPIVDFRAWQGKQFNEASDWVTQVTKSQVTALYEAAAALPADGSDLLQFDIDQIISNALSAALKTASKALSDGKGFVLIAA